MLSTKMTLPTGAFYHDDFVNGCYQPRWLRQWVLCTKMTSSTCAFCPRWLLRQVLSIKMTSSTGAIYQDVFANGMTLSNGAFVPEMFWPMGSLYQDDFDDGYYLPKWLRQRGLSTKMTSSADAFYPRWLRQRGLFTLGDFVNGCYLPRWQLLFT